MKQIKNGFTDSYYLTKEGTIYNTTTKTYLKMDSRHQFKLKTLRNNYKSISLKTLYRMVYDQEYCNDTIENLTNEEWLEIPDTNGLYWVSNMGRIKSFKGYNSKLLTPTKTKSGYSRVDIFDNNGFRHTKFVHRIVADSFLEKPKSIDDQIHHINGDKNNNTSKNLIWMSPSEHAKLHTKQRRILNHVDTKSKENYH